MHLFFCFASYMSYFAFTKFSKTLALDQPPIGNLGTYVFHSEKVQQSLMTTHQPLTEKSRHICEIACTKLDFREILGARLYPSSLNLRNLDFYMWHSMPPNCMYVRCSYDLDA